LGGAADAEDARAQAAEWVARADVRPRAEWVARADVRPRARVLSAADARFIY